MLNIKSPLIGSISLPTTDGDFILVEVATPDILPLAFKPGKVIISRGPLLSHLVILSLELGGAIILLKDEDFRNLVNLVKEGSALIGIINPEKRTLYVFIKEE